MTSLVRSALFASLFASACGGVAIEGFNGDAGSGGEANGGAGAAPGSGGAVGMGGKVGAGGKAFGTGGKGFGTGGNIFGTGGKIGGGSGGTVGSGSGPGYGGKASGGAIGIGGACCLAYPSCSPGDVQVGGPCPPDTSCYAVTACCSTIWCRQTSGCIPTMMPCKPGYKETTGPCPSGTSCYQTKNCNTLVTCVAPLPVYDAGTVNPGCSGAPPRGVRYISTSPDKCKLIDYACPAGTSGYADGCGCGCRQPDACPDYVNCQPTMTPGPQNPYCADTAKCPYTIRAY